ncbi:uncharacterized protein LOC101013117 isoform X2 [Papio anubis]|uniref:uncharacterized protein LOC101013117 isoform X2 n=1 Tax=Papio anubis TaxID=9555 RepID=UPI0004F210F2|nr:uncharacterized protein LOC101013117 isoform X2 [Papio anubis]
MRGCLGSEQSSSSLRALDAPRPARPPACPPAAAEKKKQKKTTTKNSQCVFYSSFTFSWRKARERNGLHQCSLASAIHRILMNRGCWTQGKSRMNWRWDIQEGKAMKLKVSH